VRERLLHCWKCWTKGGMISETVSVRDRACEITAHMQTRDCSQWCLGSVHISMITCMKWVPCIYLLLHQLTCMHVPYSEIISPCKPLMTRCCTWAPMEGNLMLCIQKAAACLSKAQMLASHTWYWYCMFSSQEGPIWTLSSQEGPIWKLWVNSTPNTKLHSHISR